MTDILLGIVLAIPDKMRKTNNYKIKNERRLSFSSLGIIGEEISFIEDSSKKAIVVSDKEVEYLGEKFKLSPLTRKLKEENGTVSNSSNYQGAKFWQYDGMKLSDFLG